MCRTLDLPYTYSLTATVTLPPSLCAMQMYRPWSSGRASSMRNVLSSKTLERPSGRLPLSRCHVTFGFGSPVNCHHRNEQSRNESRIISRLVNHNVIDERPANPMCSCVYKLNNYVQTNFKSNPLIWSEFICWCWSGRLLTHSAPHNNEHTKNKTEKARNNDESKINI